MNFKTFFFHFSDPYPNRIFIFSINWCSQTLPRHWIPIPHCDWFPLYRCASRLSPSINQSASKFSLRQPRITTTLFNTPHRAPQNPNYPHSHQYQRQKYPECQKYGQYFLYSYKKWDWGGKFHEFQHLSTMQHVIRIRGGIFGSYQNQMWAKINLLYLWKIIY